MSSQTFGPVSAGGAICCGVAGPGGAAMAPAAKPASTRRRFGPSVELVGCCTLCSCNFSKGSCREQARTRPGRRKYVLPDALPHAIAHLLAPHLAQHVMKTLRCNAERARLGPCHHPGDE